MTTRNDSGTQAPPWGVTELRPGSRLAAPAYWRVRGQPAKQPGGKGTPEAVPPGGPVTVALTIEGTHK